MPKFSTTHSQQKPATPVAEIARDPRVKTALDWLAKNTAWITDEQIRITEIPAPSFQEAQRAAYLRRALAACGLRVRTDDIGNVIGERPGSSASGSADDQVVLLVAHLDTVFPPDTDVHVRRESGVLYAPGIADNGAGLSSLLGVARAMNEAKLKTRRTIVFAADVGEEGEGNLRGVRQLVEGYGKRVAAVIALDGASTDYVVTQALASRRIEITVTGPGGHSWTDFGVPNPINALARGIARFLKTTIPSSPRTTFNIGEIEGGGSVNSIPARAAIKVDIRSEQEKEIVRVESALRDAIRAGIQEEMESSKLRGIASADGGGLDMQSRALGVRPGGDLPANSPLLQAVNNADRYLGNRSREERSSTDANVPLSMGIPAIAMGGGGRAGGAHTSGEWYDPEGRQLGLQRILLTALSTAGIEK
ncbi:MAG TPA: M20/M25/M40 family metallo-hydrolase [Candidatus Acidoferrum sp.]|nr:M20/M25/M40 family metallo-hydrolase [Candidatus Acidoferrum sp.]